jgi:hypothetical protein
MADFCLATKLTPTEYRKLTMLEMNEFVNSVMQRGQTLEDIF